MQNVFDFNYDWQFFKEGSKNITSDNFCEVGEMVSIPHSPRIESLDVTKPFTGVMYYRKHFKLSEELASKKIFIDFEGVMHKAKVYINGKKIFTHYGGYLPFSVNITNYIKMNINNLIVVEVDNRDDTNIPPGKPTDKVDFLYYGGIYRNVKLRAVDKLYIDRSGSLSDGIHIFTERVDGNIAYLSSIVDVNNSYFKKLRVYIKQQIYDDNGYKITEVESKPIVIPDNNSYKFETKLIVTNPILWDIDNPYRYHLYTEIFANDELIDIAKTVFGIRTVRVDSEGFYLNERLIRLNGANRHQQFPYIGIAESDRADYRDMVKLKEAGFNIVRLSHYPQSNAIMDACDELGMMVIVPTPGWQFCKRGVFRRRVLDNIRGMIRRDRNHPCAVLFETSLNETGAWWIGAKDGFFRKCVNVAREEAAPASILTCGDSIGRTAWKRIGYDVPFTGWDNQKKLRILDSEIKGLTREYGDYEFGGHNSTTRVRLSDGEFAMRVQALNFQWSHNMNIGSKYELGDIIWEGIDHNRGMGDNKPISTSGILNEWRLPKFSYYFYKSQRQDIDMVYLPTFWDGSVDGKLTVYSGADEVEIRINGRKIARKAKSRGETELFDPKLYAGEASVDYWQKGGVYDKDNSDFDLAKFVMSRLDNGKNSENLPSPPFVFDDIKYEKGYIEAIAYKNGKEVARDMVRTPGKVADIKLDIDYSGKKLLNDGRDMVFARTYVVDSEDTIVKCEVGEVEFSIENGEIIGDNISKLETGIASTLIKANRGADNVVLHAKYKDIERSIDVDIDKIDIVEL